MLFRSEGVERVHDQSVSQQVAAEVGQAVRAGGRVSRQGNCQRSFASIGFHFTMHLQVDFRVGGFQLITALVANAAGVDGMSPIADEPSADGTA